MPQNSSREITSKSMVKCALKLLEHPEIPLVVSASRRETVIAEKRPCGIEIKVRQRTQPPAATKTRQ